MPPQLTLFTPQPRPDEVPELFPDPFDESGPCALARRAALQSQAGLDARLRAQGVPASVLQGPEGGKMFGVLVVRQLDGQVGYLEGFSGMLDGRWDLGGFVPPLFDRPARAAVEPAGEALLGWLLRHAAAVQSLPGRLGLLDRLDDRTQQSAHERARLIGTHRENRQQRRVLRAQLAARCQDSGQLAAALHALDQQSRADKAALRRLDAAHEATRQWLVRPIADLERLAQVLERLRRQLSGHLMQQIHETYTIRGAGGQRRRLRELYAPAEPPSGAGDCTAPKLLAHAHAAGLRPVALAEFWWGAVPPTGARRPGRYYPACKARCAPLLPFLLEGLPVAYAHRFGAPDVWAEPLAVIFEDDWLLAVDKPAGLLSVPARDTRVGDSVLARLRARCPDATGPLVVHRLDMDTSGVLMAAKDRDSFAALQRQFAERTVLKRYVAWLEGDLSGQRGRIELPLRVDLEDRPRQIHDPVHGKPAITDWHVLLRREGRTRVAFLPRTGRTHQLRVHAAHPQGLDAPIVGDRLYGQADERLLLHAEALSFTHPRTGKPVNVVSLAPF